jgi:hypothetical protein
MREGTAVPHTTEHRNAPRLHAQARPAAARAVALAAQLACAGTVVAFGADARAATRVGVPTAARIPQVAATVSPAATPPCTISVLPALTLSRGPDAQASTAAPAGLGSAPAAPAAPQAPQTVVTDPTGDNFNPAADVTTIVADLAGGNITFTVSFAALTVPNVVCSLNLDTDQNAGTGRFPPANGAASQDVGVEYELYLDIQNGNAQPQPMCLVLDGPTRAFINWFPMTIASNTVTFTVPLATLGSDDGNMNVALGAVNVTAGLFADLAPDTGHGTVVSGGDTTRPTVTLFVPENAATGVPRDTAVNIKFSEQIAVASVNGTTLTLKQGVTPITGTASLLSGNLIARFTPSSPLAASTVYTVTATTGIQDLALNALNGNGSGGNFTSTFTTGTASALPLVAADAYGDGTGPHDLVALRMSETVTTLTFRVDLFGLTASDASASLNLDTDRNPTTGHRPPVIGLPTHDIGVEYELWMDIKNINNRPQPRAFLLNGTTRAFVGPEYPMTVGANSLQFDVPVADIGEQQDGSMDMTLSIGTVATPTFSDHLPNSGHVSFITAIDRVPPAVLSVAPPAGTQNVDVNTSVIVTFDGALNPTTVTSSTCTLRNMKTLALVPCTVTLSVGNTVVTVDPTPALADSVRHELHVTTAVKDVAGNALNAEYVSDFRTRDITRPTITSTLPSSGQTGVATGSVIRVNFSEAVAGVDRNNFKLLAGTLKIAGNYALTNASKAATLTPLLPLTGATTYTVRGETTILDLNGNALNGNGAGGPLVYTFTTVAEAPHDSLYAGTRVIAPYIPTVTIPVRLRNTFDVGGVSFRLAFDPTRLTFSAINRTPRTQGMEYVSATSPSSGVLAVTALARLAGSTGTLLATGTGSIVDVVFNVNTAQPAGTTSLTLSAAALSEQRGLASSVPAVVAGSVVRDVNTGVPGTLLPTRPQLGEPAPNPFNPRVTIPVLLPARGAARVAIYDVRGALVRVLHSGVLEAGTTALSWDGTDGQGRAAASGVYIVKLEAATVTDVRKAVLVR